MNLTRHSTNTPSSHRRRSPIRTAPKGRRGCFTDSYRTRLNGFAESDWYLLALSEPPFYASTNTVKSVVRSLLKLERGPTSSSSPSSAHQRKISTETTSAVVGGKFPSLFSSEGLMTAFLADSPASRAIFSDGLWMPLCAARGLAESGGQSLFKLSPSVEAFFTRFFYNSASTVAHHDEGNCSGSGGGTGFSCSAAVSISVAYQGTMLVGSLLRVWALSLERASQPLVVKALLASVTRRLTRGNKHSRRKRSEENEEDNDEKQLHIARLLPYRSLHWRGCVLWCRYYCGLEVADSLKSRVEENPSRRSASAFRRSKSRKQRSEGTQREERRGRRHSASPAPTRIEATTKVTAASPSPQAVDHDHETTHPPYINSAATSLARTSTTATPAGSPAPVTALPACSNGNISARFSSSAAACCSSAGEEDEDNDVRKKREKERKGKPLSLQSRRSILKGDADRHGNYDDGRADTDMQRSDQPRRVAKFADGFEHRATGNDPARKEKRKRKAVDKKTPASEERGLMTRCARSLARGIFNVLTAPLRPLSTVTYIVLAELQWQPSFVDVLVRGVVMSTGLLLRDTIQLQLAATTLAATTVSSFSGASTANFTTSSSSLISGGSIKNGSLNRGGSNSPPSGSVIVLSPPLFGLLTAGGSTQSRESDAANASSSSSTPFTSLSVSLIGIAPFALFVAVRTASMLVVTHSPLSVASRRGLLNPLYEATTMTTTTTTVSNEAAMNIDSHNTAAKKLIDEIGEARRSEKAKIILSPAVVKSLRFAIGAASHPIGHLGILHFVAAVRLSSTTLRVNDAATSTSTATARTNTATSSSSHCTTSAMSRLYSTDIAKAVTLLLASACFRSVVIPFVEHHSRVVILNALVYGESVLWHRYTDAVRRLKWGLGSEDGVGGGAASLLQGSRASRSTPSYFSEDQRLVNKNTKKRREDPANDKSAVVGSPSTRSFVYTSLNNGVSLSSRRRTNPAVGNSHYSVPTTPREGGEVVQRRGGEESRGNTTFVNTTRVGNDKIHHRNKIATTNKSNINASASVFSVRSLATTAAHFASPQCSASSLVEKVVVRRQRLIAEVAKVSSRVSRLSEQLEEYNRVSVAMLGVPLVALTYDAQEAPQDFLDTNNNGASSSSSETGNLRIATIGVSSHPKAIRQQGSENGNCDHHDHEQPNELSTRDHYVTHNDGLSQRYYSPPRRDASVPPADQRLLPPSPLATVVINKSGPLSTRSTSVVAIGGAQSVLLAEEGERGEAEERAIGLEAMEAEYGRVAFNKAPLFLPPLPPLAPQANRNKPTTSLPYAYAYAGLPSYEPPSQLFTPRGVRSKLGGGGGGGGGGGDTSSESINTTAAPPQPFAPTPPPHQHGKVKDMHPSSEPSSPPPSSPRDRRENTDRNGRRDIFEHLNEEDEDATADSQKHHESNGNLAVEALSETARPEHHLAHARDNTLPMIANAGASTSPHTALGETHTIPSATAGEHEPSMGRIDLEDVSHIAALSEGEGDVSAMLNDEAACTFDFNLLHSKESEEYAAESETKAEIPERKSAHPPQALTPSSPTERATATGRVIGDANRPNRRAVKLVDLDGTIHVPNYDAHQSINVGEEQRETANSAKTSPASASAASSSNKRSSARQSSRSKKVRKSPLTSALRRLVIGAPSRLIAASLRTTRALANFLFCTAPFTHDEAPTVMEAVVVTLLCTHTAHRDSFAALIDTPLLLARSSFAASYHLRASNSRMLRCRLTTPTSATHYATNSATDTVLHNNRDKGGTNQETQENTAVKLTQFPCGYLPLCFLFEHEAALGVHLLTRRCLPKEPLFPALGGVLVSEQRQKEGVGGKGTIRGEKVRAHDELRQITSNPTVFSAAAPPTEAKQGSKDAPTESLARWMPSSSEEGRQGGVRARNGAEEPSIGTLGKEKQTTTAAATKSAASAELSLPFTVTEANLKFISSHPTRFLTSAADDDANVLLHCQPCGIDEMAEEADAFDTALVDFLFNREVALTAAKARREERAKLKEKMSDDEEAERAEKERELNEDWQIYSIQCRQLVNMAQRVETVLKQLKEDEALLSRRVQFYTAIAGGLSRRLVVRTVWFQSFARSIADILVRFPLETLAMLIETRALRYLLLARYHHDHCCGNNTSGDRVSSASPLSFLTVADCFNFIQSEWEVLVGVLRGWGEGNISSESGLVTTTTSHGLYEGDPLFNPVIPAPFRGSAWGGVYLDARSRFILATPLYCGVLPYALFFGSSRMLSTWGDVTS